MPTLTSSSRQTITAGLTWTQIIAPNASADFNATIQLANDTLVYFEIATSAPSSGTVTGFYFDTRDLNPQPIEVPQNYTVYARAIDTDAIITVMY